MADHVRVVEFRNGRPVVISGAVASAQVTDEWLQYLVDVVANEAARLERDELLADALRYRKIREIALRGNLESSVALAQVDHTRGSADVDALFDAEDFEK